MTKKPVGTPLFYYHLKEYLDEYAEKGAVRFVEKMRASYEKMIEDIERFKDIGYARKRLIHGKKITVREYLLDAGARNFLVLYWVPPDDKQPPVLLNIRIGGQNKFKWK
jgi:hypothetical protein